MISLILALLNMLGIQKTMETTRPKSITMEPVIVRIILGDFLLVCQQWNHNEPDRLP